MPSTTWRSTTAIPTAHRGMSAWSTRLAENRTWKGWQENFATYTHGIRRPNRGGRRVQCLVVHLQLFGRVARQLGVERPLLRLFGQHHHIHATALARHRRHQRNAWIGQFLRGTYSGKELSVTATIRRDGSSRFGPENKYGIFPSFSAAWNLSERPWLMKRIGSTSLKFRASWGRNGNAEIADYGYIASIVNGLNYTLETNSFKRGFWPGRGCQSLGWETMEQYNFGFDADLFSGSLQRDFRLV